MAKLIERLGERSAAQRRRGMPKPDAYGALLRTIVGQQLSSKAARTIYGRVLDLFGGVTPSPEQILATRGRICAGRASRGARSSTSATSPRMCRAASWSSTGSTSSPTRR